MTVRSVIKRYLIEKGIYGAVQKKIRERTGRIGFNYNLFKIDDSYFFENIKTAMYMIGDYSIQYFTLYGFLKKVAQGDYSINNGDIITVKTQDGKYEFEFKVLMAWYGAFEAELEDGHRISFDRIESINGEKLNFKNRWKLKEKYINY